jgi:hypothetical protein
MSLVECLSSENQDEEIAFDDNSDEEVDAGPITRPRSASFYLPAKPTTLPTSSLPVTGSVQIVDGSIMHSHKIVRVLKDHEKQALEDVRFFTLCHGNYSLTDSLAHVRGWNSTNRRVLSSFLRH